jgi:hypothetical protein
MHYGDEEHLAHNSFQFVIYKHEDLTSKRKKADYELCSIHKCQFINPRTVKTFLDITSKESYVTIAKQYLKDVEYEKWYLFYAKELANGKLSIGDVEDVTDNVSEFMRLH